MARKQTPTHCPSCGAPLTNLGKQTNCRFCGTPIPQAIPPAAPPPVAPPRPSAPTNTPPVVVTTSGGKSAGCALMPAVLLIMIGLFAGGIVLASIAPRQISQVFQGSSLPVVATQMALGRVQSLSEIANDQIVVFYQQDQQTRLSQIDPATLQPTWGTELLGNNDWQQPTLVTSDTLLLSSDQLLWAFRRTDGTTRWKHNLTSGVDRLCRGCLQQVADRVVTLERDGTLQALRLGDGSVLWTKKLISSPRWLYRINNRLLAAGPGEKPNTTVLLVIDPLSGAIERELVPTCKSADSPLSARWGAFDPLVPIGDDQVVLLFGAGINCIQRWSITAEAPEWSQELPSAFFSASFYTDQPFYQDNLLVFTASKVMFLIDTRRDQIREVATDPEFTLSPLMLQGETLIMQAVPSWDSRRHFLWGMDRTTGEKRWERELKADEWLQAPGFGNWDLIQVGERILLIQVLKDDKVMLVDQVNVTDGSLTSLSTTKLDPVGLVVWDYAWGTRYGWMLIGSKLVMVDFATGAVSQQGR